MADQSVKTNPRLKSSDENKITSVIDELVEPKQSQPKVVFLEDAFEETSEEYKLRPRNKLPSFTDEELQ